MQGQIWVHGHATKHLYEAIKSTKEYPRLKFSNQKLYLQFLLHEFQHALNRAVEKGIIYGKEIYVENWEFKFSEAKKGFKNPVLYHALSKGLKGGL